MSTFEELHEGFGLIHGARSSDGRGYFRRLLDVPGSPFLSPFCVVNINVSNTLRKGTIRGMHFQTGTHAETKVVTCLRGAIFDVAINLRSQSAHFGQVSSRLITASSNESLVIGTGMAHGFQALEADTLIHYAVDRAYAPHAEGGISALAPPLVERWPIRDWLVSDRDRGFPSFVDYGAHPADFRASSLDSGQSEQPREFS